LSRVKGPATIKFGVDAKLHPFSSFSADNFGGTYQYASLAAYEAEQPLLFTLNGGNPLVISEQDDYAWFLQEVATPIRVVILQNKSHSLYCCVALWLPKRRFPWPFTCARLVW
jgi:hypothetical protein